MIDSRLVASGWSTWFARQVLSPAFISAAAPGLVPPAGRRGFSVGDALTSVQLLAKPSL